MHLQLADAPKRLLHDPLKCPSVSMQPAMLPLLLPPLTSIVQAQLVAAPQLLAIPCSFSQH
jgi:hypothetical protein